MSQPIRKCVFKIALYTIILSVLIFSLAAIGKTYTSATDAAMSQMENSDTALIEMEEANDIQELISWSPFVVAGIYLVQCYHAIYVCHKQMEITFPEE